VPDKAVVFKLTAVVEVDAVPESEPWKVVAVRTLLPIVIPEPVESDVPPEEAVLSTVPIRNLVAVTASVLTKAADDATAGMSDVNAIVLPTPDPVPPLKTLRDES
jgi:hypothetical protein